MSKYQFILHSAECEGFVDKLSEAGMVDITTSGWEPTEGDRTLIMEVEAIQKAERRLAEFAESEAFDSSVKGYDCSDEAWAAYQSVSSTISSIESRITDLQRIETEAAPWGEFDGEMLAKIESEGLKVNLFITSESLFDAILSERADLTITPINKIEGKVYFAVVTRSEEETDLTIDAQMVKSLTMSSSAAYRAIEAAEAEKKGLDGDLSKLSASVALLAAKRAELSDKLQLSRVSNSAELAAEGSLLVMEAWAEQAKSSKVDELLNAQSGLFYIKSNPTPEDNTPVKLENNRYARLFELVGNLYALPKYGTIDLTPFFAPFYMMFFAICLCDAGYGAIILAAGLALYFKGGESMRKPAWLSIICGVASVIFGFFANSIFGMEFSSMPIFGGVKFINFQQDFFSVSMIIGVIQILFGMVINIFVTTRSFGFKYALGSIGWFLIIFSAALSAALSSVGITAFAFDSLPFYVVEGLGFALLFFFNSPDKNIFANIGGGLWQAYDRTTGLMGDILSYIRLFAIGLSGGVLALVFNDLAIGLTGLNESWDDIGIVSLIMKIVGASIILLLGHGINLFMSAISSMVHPMRLTFVEFYKNAGFEMSSRAFNPLMRGKDSEK
ncbi:MAG: V-type ATP synthase subunit I [Rikenellaceae bacterium]